LALVGAAVAMLTGGHPASTAQGSAAPVPGATASAPPASRSAHLSRGETERAFARMMRERPEGVWKATGRVLVAHGVAGRRTGEVLGREWAFGSVCDPDHCRTTFTRTATGELAESLLRVHAGYLSAGFPRISDGCEVRPGWFADFTGHFHIWWSHHHRRLEAIEIGRYPGGEGCPPAEERIRWVARKAARTAPMRPAEPSSERTHEVL
jgi:hypothetical protein